MSNIIGVKFEDKYHAEGGFSGRQYSYFAGIPLTVGDIVIAPTRYGESKAMVTEVNLPESTIEKFRDAVKTIEKKAETKEDPDETTESPA